MIDLHIHTKYSDGTDEIIDILKKAQKLLLSDISITDHNTCEAYNELARINIKKYFNGNIIPGIELNTKILGIPIEVLAYNIDIKKMNEEVRNKYPTPKERNLIELKRIYEKCIKANVKLNQNFIENYDYNQYVSVYLHSNLIKNKANKKFLERESWNNSIAFYRKHMSNPKSAFYVDMNDILPSFKEIYCMIKECGGLIFLPHIFEYKDNSIDILNNILNNYKIDGIECYYTTFSQEQTKFLLDLAKGKKLLISGGSDYHGSYKPKVEMGVGLGNLQIKGDVIDEWKIDII